MSDFDEKTFSNEVFYEYQFVKLAKISKSAGKVMKENARNFRERLFATVVDCFEERFTKKVVENEKKKKKFLENQNQADRIIEVAGNRYVMCEALDELKTNEIITEEKFVKRFTQALYRKVSKNEIEIPLQKVLFALIAYKIFETGLDEFCKNINDEN